MVRLSSSAALSSQQRILETREGQRQGQQAGSKLGSAQAVGLGLGALCGPTPHPEAPGPSAAAGCPLSLATPRVRNSWCDWRVRRWGLLPVSPCVPSAHHPGQTSPPPGCGLGSSSLLLPPSLPPTLRRAGRAWVWEVAEALGNLTAN